MRTLLEFKEVHLLFILNLLTYQLNYIASDVLAANRISRNSFMTKAFYLSMASQVTRWIWKRHLEVDATLIDLNRREAKLETLNPKRVLNEVQNNSPAVMCFEARNSR